MAKCTLIGLGTDYTDEYESLTSSGNQYIIYTDQEYIPDIAPILGTQLLYQVQGDSSEIFAGRWNLHTDVLPCSCSPCKCNPSNRTTCIYTEDIDLKQTL